MNLSTQQSSFLVFGHTQCGGIRALIEKNEKVWNKKPYNFIAKWMEIAQPAYDKVAAEHDHISLEKKITLCEQYTLINSLHNLHGFPWVQERIAHGTLSLHAWYLDLATGAVHIYDQKNKTWLSE